MKFINKYLRNIKPYKVASHKVWSVPNEERKNILKLDWNEATSSPSENVRRAIKVLADSGDFYNLYPSTYNDRLMEGLSNYTGLPKENIQYFASSDSLHEYIARMYIGVGDPVLIVWPSYDNFRLTSEVSGAVLHYSELNEDFTFNEEKLLGDIEKLNPSLVYICNPNNPTGTLVGKDVIENMLSKEPDTMFLIDEAYAEFSGVSVNDLVLKYDNLLVTHTMSKAFGLANFRFGYLVSSVENIKDISRIRNPKNITTFTQVAVTAALEDTQYMLDYVKETNAAKEWFKNSINEKLSDKLHAYESAGNFTLIECNTPELKAHLLAGLEENNIFTRDVHQSPLLKNAIRITIGTKEQMERVLEVICKVLDK